MATGILQSLQTDLSRIVASTSTSREPQYSITGPVLLPPIPQNELRAQLQPIWEGFKVAEVLQEGDAEGSQTPGRRGDLVRNVMDIVGRELVVSPLVHGELIDPLVDALRAERSRFLTALSDRLDIVLTLYEICYGSFPDVPSLEPGAIFIPLLEELVELISVESWRDLWLYVESRSKRFTNDMPASRGKALPLLRTINAFLRFLPRTPEDLVFRGRVHQFASGVIGIADKSAINMRGDYGDIKTTWEELEEVPVKDAEEAGAETDGDVKMEGDEKDKSKAGEEAKSEQAEDSEPDFYSTLWSLQQYFASPPSLAGPPVSTKPGEPIKTPFDDFRAKSDFVLPKLFEQTVKEKELMGVEKTGPSSKAAPVPAPTKPQRKRKRGAVEESMEEEPVKKGRFFHPRYLTGRKLLEHELADSSFRRQILVQYFILFQFLLNLTPASVAKQAFTGGMPKDFVVDPEKETWVKSKIGSIREELRRMPGDGSRFEEVVLSIIARERHYAQWKNENCPEKIFEVPPLPTDAALEAAQIWKKRLEPPPRYPFPVGSRSLSRLWNKGFTSLDQLKGWKRQTSIETLTEEIKTIEADEEDDKAMGREPDADQAAENAERKTKLNWRALRLASTTSLRHFTAVSSKRDIQLVLKAEQDDLNRALQPRPKRTDSSVDGSKDEMDHDHDGLTEKDGGDGADEDDGLVLKGSEVEVAEGVEAGEAADAEVEAEAEQSADAEAPAEDEKLDDEAGKEPIDGMKVDTNDAEATAEGEETTEDAPPEVEDTADVGVNTPPTPPLDETVALPEISTAGEDVEMHASTDRADEPIEAVQEEDAELAAE